MPFAQSLFARDRLVKFTYYQAFALLSNYLLINLMSSPFVQ